MVCQPKVTECQLFWFNRSHLLTTMTGGHVVAQRIWKPLIRITSLSRHQIIAGLATREHDQLVISTTTTCKVAMNPCPKSAHLKLSMNKVQSRGIHFSFWINTQPNKIFNKILHGNETTKFECCYFGLESLEVNAQGAIQVIAERIFAALDCTSTVCCIHAPTKLLAHGNQIDFEPTLYKQCQHKRWYLHPPFLYCKLNHNTAQQQGQIADISNSKNITVY
jgi:hypothetical protein